MTSCLKRVLILVVCLPTLGKPIRGEIKKKKEIKWNRPAICGVTRKDSLHVKEFLSKNQESKDEGSTFLITMRGI